MKIRLIFKIALIGIPILLIAGFLTWHILGGEALTRTLLLKYLHSNVSPSIRIDRISPQLKGIKLRNVSFELTPSVILTADQVRIRTFLPSFILSRAKKPGIIEEIELASVRINISRAKVDTSRSLGFSYEPYPLKKLDKLKIVKKIRLEDAVVTFGPGERVLVDTITGSVDFSEISHAILILQGRLRRLPNARFEVNGFADLIGGGFLLGMQTLVNDLGDWNPPEELKNFKFNSGNLVVQVELRGSDDLRLTGKIFGEDISAAYGDKLSLSNGRAEGELFGKRLDLKGMFSVNGLPLPFEVTIEDLLTPVWQAEIPPTIFDLERLDVQRLGLPVLKGNPGIKAVLSGEGETWEGRASLTGKDVSVAKIKIDEFNLDAGYTGGIIDIDDFSGRLFGGELKADGFIDPFLDSTGINFTYNRKWTEADSSELVSLKLPELLMEGSLTRRDGIWQGLGACELVDVNSMPQLIGMFDFHETDLSINITSPGKTGRLTLTATDIIDSPVLRVKSKDPHHLLSGVLNEKYLPDFLDDYALNLELEGLKNRFKVQLNLESLSNMRSGSYHGTLTYKDRTFSTEGDLRLKTEAGDHLKGRVDAEYDPDSLTIRNVNLSDVVSGKSLLQTRFAVNTSSLSFKDIFLDADSLPVIELARFLIPDMVEGFDGVLNADLYGRNDSLQWKGELLLNHPDSSILRVETGGSYNAGRLVLDEASITDTMKAVKLFTLGGAVNLKERTADSLVARFDEFPIQSFLDLVTPSAAKRIGGKVNARLELDGAFDCPIINADMHLVSGILHENPGYWMNLRCTTDNDRYVLEKFDFGKDIKGLLNISGHMNRFSREYSFHLSGEEVDIGILSETITGKAGPLIGKANIDVSVTGVDKPHLVDAELSVSPGKIGPLSYDSLNVEFRITGFDEDNPVLNLETVEINWGDVTGSFSGNVSLIKKGEIDVTGCLKGRLLGLLPRLTRFFSRPEGEGEISLKIGGDLSRPRITEGYFNLTDGSMRLKDVVEKIDNLQINVELDRNGLIHINELEGLGNGQSFYFNSRRPLEHEEGIIIGDYDFGIIQFGTGREGIWTVVPSLMRPNWGGHLRFTGMDKQGPFEFHGPAERPWGIGEIWLTRATLTYPFIYTGAKPSPFVQSLLGLLEGMRWDGRIIPYQVCRYNREISGFGKSDRELLANTFLDVDVKVYVDLMIDDNHEGLHFTGSLQDTLHIRGELTSTKGSVEYLDLAFDVDKIGAVFNPVELEPIFYGGVRTNVIDSTGIMREVRWVIRKTDQDLGLDASQSDQYLSANRGRWSEISFVFEDDQHHSQEQILAMLGYSPEALPDKLADLGGKLVSDVTPIRRWTRSLERQVERWLGVDRVDIDNRIAQNYLREQWTAENENQAGNEERQNFHYLRSLDHSRLTVGKYLSRDIYMSYTGSLLSNTDAYYVTRIGVIHTWDLLFRLHQIAPNLMLNYRYEYDSLTKSDDSRIFFRFSYTFK